MLSTTDALRVIDILSLNLETYSPELLLEVRDDFQGLLKSRGLCSGRSLELFPKILGLIGMIKLLPDLKTGPAYVELAINEFCSAPWPRTCVVRIAAMFRDVVMTPAEQKYVVSKLVQCISDMDPDELPPLVYQMCLLATKVSFFSISLFPRCIRSTFALCCSAIRSSFSRECSRSWEPSTPACATSRCRTRLTPR